MKNHRNTGIGISAGGRSVLERECLLFKSVVQNIERQVGVKFIRPWPSTREALEVTLPAECAKIVAHIAGKSDLDSIEITYFRPFLGWLNRHRCSAHEFSALVQIGEMYKKIHAPCADKYIKSAVQVYHSDEEDLVAVDSAVPTLIESRIGRLAQELIYSWVGDAPRISVSELRSGPGAVASGHNHVLRWMDPFTFRNASIISDIDDAQRFFHVSVGEPQSSRMIAVPKTAVKPRLIAAEPSWNSFIQQALMRHLRRRMCRFPWLDITDQGRNGALAFLPDIATIDQSRASDRVSWRLVCNLFPVSWVEAFEACRTESVVCLCGETHHLRKFAGMGSGVTFPVETLVFAALALASFMDWSGSTDPSGIDFSRWGFYGDDAIVPVYAAPCVLDAFKAAGFIVNEDKSYWSGDFRESCGVYSFRGVDVTPVRRAYWLPSTRSDTEAIEATVHFFNGLKRRFWDVGELRPLSGITNMPDVPYSVDHSGPKTCLVRQADGFGWWTGLNFTYVRHRACTSSFARKHPVITDEGERVREWLSLIDLEREDFLCPRTHLTIDEWYEPRPVARHLHIRRVGER